MSPWGVCNTSVNVRKHKFIINEARKKNEIIMLMDCLCQTAHNTAAKAEKVFGNLVVDFNIEQFLFDLYFILTNYPTNPCCLNFQVFVAKKLRKF